MLEALGEVAKAALEAAKETVKEAGEKVAETAKEIIGKGESIFPDFFQNMPSEPRQNTYDVPDSAKRDSGKTYGETKEDKSSKPSDTARGFEHGSSVKTEEQNQGRDFKQSDVKKADSILEGIEKSIGTPEGIEELMERHPEKAELWKSQLEALETMNDPDASPAEIRSAQARLSVLKGQLLETAVKDGLADAGFDVEPQQRVVEGESGGTRPDIIAKNNTDQPIEALGVTVQPGEIVSVECKCGHSEYMTNQLNNHIPNQLSGQEGTKVLLTTSDIEDTPSGLAESVCEKYGANLVVADVSADDVEKAIKEAAKA